MDLRMNLKHQSAILRSYLTHATMSSGPGIQKAFLQDVRPLKATFDEYGNPLLETSSDLLVLDTTDITDGAVIDTVNKIEKLSGTV